MELIINLINNSTFYYCLMGVVYVLCIIFVVMLLVKRKHKKYEQPKKIEQKKDFDSMDLESVLSKMQEEVEKPKDEIMTFEEEQEEKAIISYQELLKAVKKNVDEVTEPKEIKQEPILEIKEELDEEKSALEPIVLQNDSEIKVTPAYEKKSSKFQNSEFISPIYGRVDNEVEYPKIKSFEEPEQELDKTIVLPKIDSKMDDNDEFLRILKEFRSNLE